MKISATTNNPENLVKAINTSIEKKIVKTWKKVLNANSETLYSHTPEQWDETAMLQPSIQKGRAEFKIAWWSKKGEPDKDVKGYVLGRFTELLMVHFASYFEHLQIEK